MNGARGEVLVHLAGGERRLCLTLGALAEMETALGVEGLEALAERMRRLAAKDVLAVLAALLRGGGEDGRLAGSVEPAEAVAAVAAGFEAAGS